MANVSIEINNREFLIACSDGDEEKVKKVLWAVVPGGAHIFGTMTLEGVKLSFGAKLLSLFHCTYLPT